MFSTFLFMIKDTSEGVLVNFKIIPQSSTNQVVGFENDRVKVKVKSAPEKGKANRELLKFLSTLLKIPFSSLKIVRGESSTLKTIFIPLKEKELRKFLKINE